MIKYCNKLYFSPRDNSCPVKTVKVKIKKESEIWITKGIQISREKLNISPLFNSPLQLEILRFYVIC